MSKKHHLLVTVEVTVISHLPEGLTEAKRSILTDKTLFHFNLHSSEGYSIESRGATDLIELTPVVKRKKTTTA